MPSSKQPRVEREPRHTSSEADLAQQKAELRDLLRYWSQAAAARGISQKTIRTVRIACELGAEDWDFVDLDAPLVAAVAFVPGSEIKRVALARYCLEHFSEWGSVLWRYRRQKLMLLNTEALAAARDEETRRERSQRGQEAAANRPEGETRGRVLSWWNRLASSPEHSRPGIIAPFLGITDTQVRAHVRALRTLGLIEAKKKKAKDKLD